MKREQKSRDQTKRKVQQTTILAEALWVRWSDITDTVGDHTNESS